MKQFILIAAFFFACIQVRAQTQNEIGSLIKNISIEVDSSQSIVKNGHAEKILRFGLDVIPILAELFTDTEKTTVYSKCQEMFLTKGDIAIILADRIRLMPYRDLTGIQNCLLTFCDHNNNLIEFYLMAIHRDGVETFKSKYLGWFNRTKDLNLDVPRY